MKYALLIAAAAAAGTVEDWKECSTKKDADCKTTGFVCCECKLKAGTVEKWRCVKATRGTAAVTVTFTTANATSAGNSNMDAGTASCIAKAAGASGLALGAAAIATALYNMA